MKIYDATDAEGPITYAKPGSTISAFNEGGGSSSPATIVSGKSFEHTSDIATRAVPWQTTPAEAVQRCTAGRPHAFTEEFAYLIGKAPQTVRKIYSQTGSCFGIIPLKLGNRLLWPVDAIARLLGGNK
jgi:hypothetical protein